MQWDTTTNAGFTMSPKPWLAVNPNYKEINAKQAMADGNSIYHYFNKMITIRQKTPTLIYGNYKDLDPQNAKIYAFTRTMGNDQYLVILNFSPEAVTYSLPAGIKAGKLQISNMESAEEHVSEVKLRGWEARVYRMEN